jgi:hypothetical protein
MKRFFVLLWVSVGLMLVPSAAYCQGPGDASAKPDAQAPPDALAAADVQPLPAAKPAPIEPMIGLPPLMYELSPAVKPNTAPVPYTVIGLPQPPFMELSVNPLLAVAPSVASPLCPQPCSVSQGLPVGRFSSFVPAAAQVGAKTSLDTRFAFEAALAQGFARIHSFTFVAEFPVVFNPNGDVKSGNTLVARSYSSLFFTPALRIMYAPDRDTHRGYPAVYPFISLGGGLAHFSPSSISLSGGASGAKSSTEGALQAGAGVDIGIYRKSIALRAEVRDFYTGPPNLGVAGINLRHNVVAGAGIVFRLCKSCWAGRKSDQTAPTASPAHN